MRNAWPGSALSRACGAETSFPACTTSESDRHDAAARMNDAPVDEASEEAILWAQVGRLGTADPRPIDLFRPSSASGTDAAATRHERLA